MLKHHEKKEKAIKADGVIKTYDRGYGWLPKNLREELDSLNPTEIPYICDANCAILLRKGATQQDVLNGLSALIHHLSAKWRIPEDRVREILSWLSEKGEIKNESNPTNPTTT